MGHEASLFLEHLTIKNVSSHKSYFFFEKHLLEKSHNEVRLRMSSVLLVVF